MTLESLNSALEEAFAYYANRSSSSSSKKQRDPYDMLADPGGGILEQDSNFGAQEMVEQYQHYRGRFYSACRVVVQRFAQQPVMVARRGVRRRSRNLHSMLTKGVVPAGGIPDWIGDPESLELLSVHPLLSVLRDPNPHITPFNMKEILVGSIFATGQVFLVSIPGEDRPFDEYPIPSTWMKPLDKDGYRSHWLLKPPSATGKGIEIPDSQVAHFYFADPANPASALSPLSVMARAVLADEAIAGAQYSEFKNGPVPKVALIAGDVMNETGFDESSTSSRPVRLEPHQRRQIVTWFRQQFANVNKYGMPLVLDAVIRDLKVISRKPAEMAFMESSGLTKDQIDEGVGVSKILRGQLDGVNRASGVLAEQFMVDYTLNPLITSISQALTKKKGRLYALGREELVVWVAPVVPRDVEADIEYLRLGIRSYAVRRNDVRDILRQRFGGLPRLNGFDDVVIPQTMEPVDPEDNRPGVGRLSFESEAEQKAAQLEGELSRVKNRNQNLKNQMISLQSEHENNGRG